MKRRQILCPLVIVFRLDNIVMSRDVGLSRYYSDKLDELDVVLREKERNVRRLEAQRNDWNEKGEPFRCLSFF